MPGVVIIRMLIIHRDLGFSLKIKRTLEQLGGFEVTPFTTLENALDYLQNRQQHIALVDFSLPKPTGEEIIDQLRAVQPQLLIIGTPDIPEVVSLAHQMGLAEVVDTPLSTRELVPILRNVLVNAQDDLPETAEAPIIDETFGSRIVESGQMLIRASEPSLESSSGFSVNPHDPDYKQKLQHKSRTLELVLNAQSNVTPETPPDGMSESAIQTFKQLASEEPPMPTELGETGTIHDLKAAVGEIDIEKVAHAMENIVYITPQLPDGLNETDDDSPVAGALKALTDESLSLTDLRESMQQEFPETQGIKPLPSWGSDRKRYVEEPDFLDGVPDTLPEMNVAKPPKARPSIDSLLARSDDNETDVLPKPAVELPEYKFDDQQVAKTPDPLEKVAHDHPKAELPVPEESDSNVLVAADDNALLADLALKLTQYSLELSAEATLLAQGGQIIAHAGSMPIEDIHELGEGIGNDWDAQPGEARIRFVTLSSSGQDFMIHTRHTEHDFVLSMIFAGNMQLRAMRLQSDRLLEALRTIPALGEGEEEQVAERSLVDDLQERELRALEEEAAQVVEAAIESTQAIEEEHGTGLAATFDEMPQLPTPDFAGPLTAYTFLWVIRDDQDSIQTQTAQILSRELERQLTEMGWQVENLQIHEDYAYLLADVPGDAPSYEIVNDLKMRSAAILQVIHKAIDPARFWADSYCVLAPGREMDTEEIQRYINFACMS